MGRKNEKVFLLIAAGLSVFALFFHFAFLPAFSRNATLGAQVRALESRFSRYSRLLEQKDSIRSEFGSLTPSVLPAKGGAAEGRDTLVGMLSELELLAKTADIRIIDIRPQGPGQVRGRDRERPSTIDIRTEGEMEGYMRFVHTIENSALLLRINRLQLNLKPHTSVLEGHFSIAQFSAE